MPHGQWFGMFRLGVFSRARRRRGGKAAAARSLDQGREHGADRPVMRSGRESGDALVHAYAAYFSHSWWNTPSLSTRRKVWAPK